MPALFPPDLLVDIYVIMECAMACATYGVCAYKYAFVQIFQQSRACSFCKDARRDEIMPPAAATQRARVRTCEAAPHGVHTMRVRGIMALHAHAAYGYAPLISRKDCSR